MPCFEDSPEAEMLLHPDQLSPRKNVVRRFYKDLWDRADVRLIPELFHEGFSFRGSLGPVLKGEAQFADYMRWLTRTLEGYTSDILEMTEEGNRVTAKMRFHGIHRETFFHCPPTGRRIWWYGAPSFQFEGDKIRDLWVLGDIYGLIQRMQNAASAIEFTQPPK